MSLTVVGSIAFDAVKTPFGERDKMLGGSAVHFSLASSFFTDVHVVGPVGEDFGATEYQVLLDRGVNTDGIEQVAGGRTFFWRGHYEYDLNTAHTDDTQLNVFGEFEPKLTAAAADSDVLFLANIQPDLQHAVAQQHENRRFTALDSMNLWIETAPDSLKQTIELVDAVFMNDAEVRQFTGKPNLLRAAREILALGPRLVVAKQGEYGAALYTADSYFSLPAYPLEDVFDPTGAGDSFAGGFLGYITQALKQGDELGDDVYRRAMAYGSVLASFNVERFGTERVSALTSDEIAERFEQFQRITRFDSAAVSLR